MDLVTRQIAFSRSDMLKAAIILRCQSKSLCHHFIAFFKFYSVFKFVEQARPLRDGTLDPAEVKLVRVSVVQDDHQPRVLHGQAAFLLEASEGREILGILLDLLNFDLS